MDEKTARAINLLWCGGGGVVPELNYVPLIDYFVTEMYRNECRSINHAPFLRPNRYLRECVPCPDDLPRPMYERPLR